MDSFISTLNCQDQNSRHALMSSGVSRHASMHYAMSRHSPVRVAMSWHASLRFAMSWHALTSLLGVLYLSHISDTYNIQVENPLIIRASPVPPLATLLATIPATPLATSPSYHGPGAPPSPPSTHFGYAIFQLVSADNATRSLLVGAPRARQGNFSSYGAVFKCDIRNRQSKCKDLRLGQDLEISFQEKTKFSYEIVTNQSLGITVFGSSDANVVGACAPRYSIISGNTIVGNRREFFGRCITANFEGEKQQEFVPGKQELKVLSYYGHPRYDNLGLSMTGMSAAVSDDDLLMGSPGAYYWQGKVDLVNLKVKARNDSLPKEAWKSSWKSLEDFSYLGLVMAVTKKIGNRHGSLVVVGKPKGAGFFGCVVFFLKSDNGFLSEVGQKTGDQFASLFGFSVSVADVNGDRLDDVLVGVPLARTNSRELGGVVVYHQQKTNSLKPEFSSSVTLLPPSKDVFTRFGSTTTSLGDVTNDNFDDVAVGAPYGGKERRGVVYIYHGAKSGLANSPAQTIDPEAFSAAFDAHAFGLALHGAQDLDDNGYPDLSVGVFKGDAVVQFWTKPLVDVTNFTAEVIPQSIDLSKRLCSLEDSDTRHACAYIRVCLTYAGRGVEPELVFDFHLTFDPEKNRAVRGSTRQSKLVRRGKKLDENCEEVKMYLKNDIKDKLTPIPIKVEFRLQQDGGQDGRKDTNPSGRPPSTLRRLPTPLITSATATIAKNCGSDDVCIPDLKVTHSWSGLDGSHGGNVDALDTSHGGDVHVLGSHNEIQLHVDVFNFGEEAYNTKLSLVWPKKVNFLKEVSGECQLQCNTCHAVSCDAGNPLPRNVAKPKRFSFVFETSEVRQSKVGFEMEASSDNKENRTEKDNQRVATLKMVALSPLTIKGESKPKQTNYDNGTIREDVIAQYITSQSRQSALEFHSTNKTSPRIRHVFVVENPGPSQVKAVDFAVNWPAYLGDVRHYHLLYLVDVDVTSGSGKCEAESIDPRHLWVLETENETYPNSGVNAARRRESVADSSSSDNAGLAARLSSLFDRQTNPSLECPGPQKPTKIKSRATLQKTLKEKPGTRERASVTRAISSRVTCVQISCHFDFEISDGATVEVTSYLWTPTLNTKWPEGVEVKLTSAANAWIVSRPEDYPSDSEEGMDIQSTPYHVTTTLSPWRLPPRPLEIPLWVVGVSVGGGLFLLLLLIFILRKLGFFVRKKEKDFRRMTHRAEKLKSYSLEEMEDL